MFNQENFYSNKEKLPAKNSLSSREKNLEGGGR